MTFGVELDDDGINIGIGIIINERRVWEHTLAIERRVNIVCSIVDETPKMLNFTGRQTGY